jgi:acetyl-CoA C-acetyltransferase
VDIVIVGVGLTPVREHWELSLRDLAFSAVEKTVHDAQGLRPDSLYVGNMFSPVVSHQAQVATLIADYIGLRGIEATTIEAAGASGGAALRMAYMAVSSGLSKVSLVVGVEKTTDRLPAEVEAAFVSAADSDYESVQGLTLTSQAALLMKRYLHETQAPREAFADIPVVAHANAAKNINAMFRSPISRESYLRAGMVSDPINMFDAAPYADGAAALLITRADLLPPGLMQAPVKITGAGLATASVALHDRSDPLVFDAARLSVERACRQAGILPTDIDLFELYDAYSIYAVLALEAAGFAERGQGWRLIEEGKLSLTGELPISTFGGLKARGNPGGATGVYQAVEAVLQLRGEAGLNQVPEARRALIQCLGGPASVAATHVFEIFG